MVKVDLSEADDYEVPPEGQYRVEVVDASAATAKGSGHPMIKLEMKVVGESGIRIFDNLMMAGKGAGIGTKKAAAFGISLKDGDDVDPTDFIGIRAIAHCVHEKYKQYTNLKVDIGQGEFCGYDPDFQGKSEPQQPKDGTEKYDFDDIPF